MAFITPDGSYYEGPGPVAVGSTEVPVRPSALHEWTGSAWEIPLARAKLVKAAELKEACRAANQDGFYSTAIDGVTQYYYSTDNSFGDSHFDGIDMLFLGSAYSKALANRDVPGWVIGYPCKSPSDLSLKEYNHTAAQMIQAGDDGFAFIKTLKIKE